MMMMLERKDLDGEGIGRGAGPWIGADLANDDDCDIDDDDAEGEGFWRGAGRC